MNTDKKLLLAITDLCNQGIVCAPNACCSSCAARAIIHRVDSMKKKDFEDIKGCLFFLAEEGDTHLAYGSIPHPKHGKLGLPSVEVGKFICEVLKKNGVKYEWNGDSGKQILLKKTSFFTIFEPSMN